MTSGTIYGTAVGGTIVSATGTALQTSEVLQWVSLAITIIGAIISFIVIPILDFCKNRKEKGSTDIEDVTQLMEDLSEGLEKTKEVINKEKGGSEEDERDDNGKTQDSNS